ncbi:MAG: hypothetical protein CSA65_08545 [Proteobacteria bacterium]|nr:MAG: hypothetical protein CSA65_08545 [Pseudomonadota bacterium]
MLESFGRYELIERLGFGGMAEVFLARTNGVGGFEKLLAIKRLLPHCTEDQQTVDLLADEAHITVQLTHPNIVQVFDFGQIDGSYFIAMEYVDGLDLKTLVQLDEERSRPLPTDVALHTVISVLEGLDFAHKRRDDQGEELGIIHRDVSPHNVLLSRHGHIKLTDFGVARARISSHVSVVGDIRGKFSYMPPEQACGGEIDHRVDIFATGAILYELLSGIQPFRSTSTGEQMKLLSSKIPPPSSIISTLPPALDTITLCSLATNPEHRFETAGEFATELKTQLEILGGERTMAQRKLAALVDQRFQECVEEERPEADERSQMRSFAELAGGFEESLIFDSANPPKMATGEIPSLAEKTYDDDSLRSLPSVAFSDALLQEAAKATGEHPAFVEERNRPDREDRTAVMRNLPQQDADGPAIAYAPTALHLPAQGNGLDPVGSDVDRTQVHATPLEALDLARAEISREFFEAEAKANPAKIDHILDNLDPYPTERQQQVQRPFSALPPPEQLDTPAEVDAQLPKDLAPEPIDDLPRAHLDAPEHLPPEELQVQRHPRAMEIGRPTVEVDHGGDLERYSTEITRRETNPEASSPSLGRYALGRSTEERIPEAFVTAPPLADQTAESTLPPEPRTSPTWVGWVMVASAAVLGLIIAITVATC